MDVGQTGDAGLLSRGMQLGERFCVTPSDIHYNIEKGIVQVSAETYVFPLLCFRIWGSGSRPERDRDLRDPAGEDRELQNRTAVPWRSRAVE